MKGKRLRYKRDRGKEERGHGIKIWKNSFPAEYQWVFY
jgi:hypothetical protein